MNSNRKGKTFEREVARYLREECDLKDARRGQQFKGWSDSPDVVGLPGFHIECKRTEHLRLYEALKQSIRDCGEDEKPIVIYRKNREESVVILRLTDFMEVIKDAAIHAIEEQPTVDAVPVCRCRDCKWCEYPAHNSTKYGCKLFDRCVKPDWFCADGKMAVIK